MDNFFNEDDLEDLLQELNTEDAVSDFEEDEEMKASQKRYMDIIKKHKGESED